MIFCFILFLSVFIVFILNNLPQLISLFYLESIITVQKEKDFLK